MYRYFAFWIFWSFWASTTGWILSSLRLLNGFGYTCAALVGLVLLFLYLRQSSEAFRFRRSLRQILSTLFRGWRRRPLQALFALLALFIFIGGALYIPWSFDATTYRLPRILYWWAHNGWYWTNSPDNRMDYSGTGFEWQMLPLLLLTLSDRFLFLLNWIPYLFMPALLLRFFRSFNLNRPLSSVLMWVIPSGFCYALQAGGIQNDAYGVFCLLAAFVFLDDYAQRGNKSDLVISLLAAALLTGAKLSNVFLLLPYGVQLAFVLYHRKGDCALVLVAGLASLLASFVPLTILCYIHTGDWSGDPHNSLGVKATHPFPVLIANLVLIANDLTQPPCSLPIKPELDRFSAWFNQTRFSHWLAQRHPNYGGLYYGEFAYEGGTGLGMGVALFLLTTGALHLPSLIFKQACYPNWLFPLIAAASWLAFFTSLSLVSSNSMARIAAPYYPLLIATLPWMKCRGPWDRSWLISGAGCLALATALFLVLIAPIRPALPMISILRYLGNDRHLEIARTTLPKYQFWAGLRDDLSEMRAALPGNNDPIGYAGAYRETSYGLWKPLGSRKIFELMTPDPRDLERSRNIHMAIVTEKGIAVRFGMSLAEWRQRYRVEVRQVFQFDSALTAKSKPDTTTWMLVTWK